ncbi:tripartite tricarboxylate transporter substrate binding protein [Xylophilus sp. GOD-11R]|uniref:Bug family tripartite tricarboxylate transporter substrate binding protein n=1 Tax=Xylophilus sp. GOD-11R TaxID=3089814 RepID=UPI00298BF26A|nr:tripartite tricarboxylate transporter substrate binding protein [Xylophilus sp. GOD-11R]WPB55494.1 tripartite tricarboxylate transporter substrate binding protein [Xylophilus sp. GOD-11R]
MPITTRRQALAAGAAALVSPAWLQAQEAAYPSRSLRMVVPFPPAGAADFLGRTVGERLQASLGQQVLIDNRAGAGGNIGTQAAAQGDREGYTLLLTGVPFAVNRFLFRTLPFDPDRDFEPVALIATVPNLMIVPIDSPANTVEEFVAYARKRPGQVNFASIGNGTSLHLAGAQFNTAAKLDMVHVPYKETGTANADLMAGRVDVMFQTISAAAGLVRGGKVKALAVTSDVRVGAFSSVPTLREAGVDLVSVGWFGLLLPAHVPEARKALLERQALAAIREPAVSARIADSGCIPRPMGGKEFAAFIDGETRRLGEVVRNAGIVAS